MDRDIRKSFQDYTIILLLGVILGMLIGWSITQIQYKGYVTMIYQSDIQTLNLNIQEGVKKIVLDGKDCKVIDLREGDRQ